MTDRYEKNHAALAHEIWAAAQLAPGEGIVDGAARVEALLRKMPHPAITHCDNCGCDWLDNGLNPIGCPYCKQHDVLSESDSNHPIKYYKHGGVIYAVHGTSSINYVERLLAKIADLESELENERAQRRETT